MPRIDLQVAFPEKDEAKRLGALGMRKVVHPSSMRACGHCEVPSSEFAIMLPPGYEVLNVADDPADDCSMDSDGSTLLSYLSDVPESIAAQP